MEIDEQTVMAELGRLYIRTVVQQRQLREVVGENRRLEQRVAQLTATEEATDGLPG